MTKRKREKDKTRERSLELLYFWYRNRVRDGNHRYDASGKELTITELPREPSEYVPGKTTKKLTANGIETISGSKEILGSYPGGQSTDPKSRFGPFGSQRRKKYEQYARSCLFHVTNINPTFHMAMEMHAANWDLEVMSVELECGPRKVRTHIECGLAVISSYRILVKP